MQRELNARVLFQERTKQAGKNVLRDGGGDSEREFSGNCAVGAAKFTFGLRNQCCKPAGVAEQDRPLSGQGNAPSCAIEEPHSEIAFQRFDLERNCRLSQEKMFGGSAKVQLLGDHTKYLEAEVLQLGHAVTIMHKNISPVRSRIGSAVIVFSLCGRG